ncbi:unnamed protein product [Effrenium voratum]|nr:unnamed protein product [Effrenium voratum]
MWLRQKSEGSHGLGFAAPARVSNSKQALNQSRSYDPETNSKPTKLQTNESLLNNLTILKRVHPPEDQPVISSQNPPQHAAYGWRWPQANFGRNWIWAQTPLLTADVVAKHGFQFKDHAVWVRWLETH